MLKKLRNRASFLDIHTKEVVSKSAKSTLVKASGIFINLLVSIFLARVLGADGLGVINLSNRVVNIVIIFCLLGTPKILLREIAVAFSQQDWAKVNNYMRSAYIINGSISLVISSVGIIITPWLASNVFNEERLSIPLMLFFGVINFQVFSRIFASGINGFRKIWQSNLVNQTLSISVTGLLILVFWLFKLRIDIETAAILFAIGRIVVTITIGIYWRSLLPSGNTSFSFLHKPLLKSSLPLLFVTLSAVIVNMADGIMLGWLQGSKDVGLYSVASRLAMLTSFFLLVTNSAISPKIAVLYSQGKMKQMEKLVQRITTGLIVFGALPVLVYLFFGEELLSIWGHEFKEANLILIIISIGQLFNISTGATGYILIMCGFEKTQGIISLFSLIFNIALNYFLIKAYGAMGAAISTAATMALQNIVKLIVVKVKLNVMTIPLPFIAKKD